MTKTEKVKSPKSSNKDATNLRLFLNDHEVYGKKVEWTHTSMSDPKGLYNIPEDKYPEFLNLYTNALKSDVKLFITEKHKNQGPIVIDFDFVQAKENKKRHYTDAFVRKCIKIYNSVIMKFLDLPSQKIICFVTEKKKPVLRSGKYHDGLHFVYPYICTKPDTQFLMRSEFIKIAKEKKLFDKLPLFPEKSDPEDIFDKSVIHKTGWLLYGSQKGPDVFPYLISKVYLQDVNKELFNIYFPKKNDLRFLVTTMAIRKFFGKNDCAEFNEGMDPVDLHKEINEIKSQMENDGLNKIEVLKLMGDDIGAIKVSDSDEVNEARMLMTLISPKKADGYSDWNRIGMCLHDIDYRLLEDWIKFSQLCPEKFKKGDCEKRWRKFKSYGFTLSSLHFWARTDNPEKYLKYHDEKMDAILKNTKDTSHYSVARVMFEKYRHQFRCASLKGNIWYEFESHRWKEIERGYTLRRKISVEIKKDFNKMVIHAFLIMAGKEDDDERDIAKKKAEGLHKLMAKFGDNGYKDRIMAECQELFYDPKFAERLDENGKLFCFDNGVLDLETMTFRPGCPDDYVTKFVDYNFPDLSDDDEMIIEVKSFLKKILPVKKIRKYFLTLLATCLEGSIREENIYVLTGSGSNGKSKIMELLKHALQLYFKPMDIRLLTEKRGGSSNASPELADKKGVRCCPLDEPKATDEINTSFMKILTGGDEITARALYREPIYFKPQCKLFLICNELPEINADDDGTWRRIKTIRFLAKFVKKSDEKPKTIRRYLKHGMPLYHHWADKELSEKIPEWKEAFMAILLKYYKEYRTNGLKHPKEVRQATEEYRKKCDVFQDFIGDYIQQVDSQKKCIPMLTLFVCMKRWYRAHYTDNKCPNYNAMKEYFKRRVIGFNHKDNMLYGYTLKVDNEDLDQKIKSVGNSPSS